MHRSRIIHFRALLVLAATVPSIAPLRAQRIAYPPATRGTVADTYFGTRVADPYRWMEDVNSPQT
ncbi:MAG TPA: hypothetical protein VGT98_16480, partial [Candidatus Elarobacter sp.]|nr:hypothetical protein [Candidatus Elarobacter sp.]